MTVSDDLNTRSLTDWSVGGGGLSGEGGGGLLSGMRDCRGGGGGWLVRGTGCLFLTVRTLSGLI